MLDLLEGEACFNLDNERCGAHKRVVFIRANIILLGLVQLYFSCTFLILTSFSYHILLKYMYFKG